MTWRAVANWFSTLEQRVRDAVFGPAVDFIIPRFVRPNHISVTRFVLVVVAAIAILAKTSLTSQVVILLVASATDCLDGVLARRRHQCTALGSLLDQVADWALGLCMACLVIVHGLLPWHIALLIAAPQAVNFATDRPLHRTVRMVAADVAKGHLRPKRSMAALAESGGQSSRPGSNVIQLTTLMRAQFPTVLTAFSLLLFGKAFGPPAAVTAGYGFLYLEVVFSFILAIRGVLLMRRG